MLWEQESVSQPFHVSPNIQRLNFVFYCYDRGGAYGCLAKCHITENISNIFGIRASSCSPLFCCSKQKGPHHGLLESVRWGLSLVALYIFRPTGSSVLLPRIRLGQKQRNNRLIDPYRSEPVQLYIFEIKSHVENLELSPFCRWGQLKISSITVLCYQC